jgi:adenosylmethionine-8-amino-7-oxononanoate aminotransferase
MRELVPLCHRYGTLVIADEVACGFGRTGKMFACEHFDLEPDLMCLAKALTSGVAPLATTLATEDVARHAELHFYATFGWHPLAVEAAIATVRYWQRHGEDLLDNIEQRGNEIRKLELPDDAELRISGLAVGIDLGDEDRVERITQRCRKEGLLVAADGETLSLFPALTIDEDTLADGLRILQRLITR